MGEVKKYILDGYRFETEAAYERARNEMEGISEIKKKNDLREEAVLRKIYDEIIENGAYQTPIGIGFLREIQKKLIQNPEQKKTMKAIPVKISLHKEKRISTKGEEETSEIQLRRKIRNLRIIVFFSVLIVAVLFTVTIYDRNMTPEKARESVLNEYASWKEELEAKEAELRLREKEVKQKEEGMRQEDLKEVIEEKSDGESSGESKDSGS